LGQSGQLTYKKPLQEKLENEPISTAGWCSARTGSSEIAVIGIRGGRDWSIPANPQLVQQLDVINRQLDEAFNKHDAVAVAALFTRNAILVAPLGIFSGRDGIEKYFTDVFRRFFCKPSEPKSSKILAPRSKHAVDGFHQPFK
jgi:hypothetical protein